MCVVISKSAQILQNCFQSLGNQTNFPSVKRFISRLAHLDVSYLYENATTGVNSKREKNLRTCFCTFAS